MLSVKFSSMLLQKKDDEDKIKSMFPDYSRFTGTILRVNSKRKCCCSICEHVRDKGNQNVLETNSMVTRRENKRMQKVRKIPRPSPTMS